jgi:predicted nucleotide-binding protein (sugar kinase/HSP70/actin superfamily)
MQSPIVSFPHMGESWIIMKAFFETLGLKVLVPPYNNEKTMKEGVINSPECVCIPYKITLGSMIEALKMGANCLFMIGGQRTGLCRLPQYVVNQEKTLREMGFEFEIYKVGDPLMIQRLLTKDLKELSGNPKDYYKKLIKALRIVWIKTELVDLTNQLSRFYRVYETNKGKTNKVREEMLKMVDDSKEIKELKKARKTIDESFKDIDIDKKREVVRILIGGEFYSVLDSFINCDIERRLAELNVLVENPTSFSYLIKAKMGLGIRKKLVRLGLKYVPVTSGGEDLPTIGRIEYFRKKGIDGYIILFPMGCLPETAIIPILDHLGKKFDLPIIHFSIDENLSETYLQTRLEAFINTIKRRKWKKNII